MLQVTGESLNMDPSFKEAMEVRDKENWLKAIDGVYSNMINHKVFELKKRSLGMKTLKSKLVLKMKETEDLGTLEIPDGYPLSDGVNRDDYVL
jgi:hypothetical protein